MLNVKSIGTNRSFFVIRLCLTVFLLYGLFATAAVSQVSSTTITREEALASLKTNRDRLLSTYALQNGYYDRSYAWSVMSPSQKGVFLTLTDYLGRRSFMHFNDNYEIIYSGDEDDQGFGCAQMNEGNTDVRSNGAYVHPLNYYGPACFQVSGDSCVQMGKCYYNSFPRTDYDMVLNHVTKIYAINGSNGNSCHGMEYNRIFFSADNELIYLLRNIQFGLPTWGNSTDLAGPHSPFTQSREGLEGTPKGQMHEWAWDYQVSYMTRPGVYGVYDPHLVEMDIDYTLTHPSNPECFYNNIYGRTFYQNYWSVRGLGGSAEFDYDPTPNGKE